MSSRCPPRALRGRQPSPHPLPFLLSTRPPRPAGRMLPGVARLTRQMPRQLRVAAGPAGVHVRAGASTQLPGSVPKGSCVLSSPSFSPLSLLLSGSRMSLLEAMGHNPIAGQCKGGSESSEDFKEQNRPTASDCKPLEPTYTRTKINTRHVEASRFPF